ncbi:MAG: adenosylcobinamide-phosphate synthase CbiB [Tannerellaceae bacterium]|jgi:adenosylcobinamide-phosphate synthase|nr:adenosylcobinamide-phosphate synthase CbiB [Tannerellaceae bacterium]
MNEILLHSALPLLAGWLLDLCLGDPPWLPHPVVGFGKLIDWGVRRLNVGRRRLLKGGILAVGLILATFFSAKGLLLVAGRLSPVAELGLSAILVFYGLAGTTLIRELRLVFEAVARSTEEGRQQLSRIVGRDTSHLSAQEVRAAALETLAENLSDGVVAPLFWFALLGVPGMLAYKMVNTLDSMIGYKNERFLLFGRVAARLDDLANYLPARLTALLMIVVSGRLALIKFVCTYGGLHSSPNAGYPESALAGILDCRFGGTHHYFGQPVYKPYIGVNERPLSLQDMQEAIGVNRRVECLMLLVLLLLMWVG